MNPVPAAADRMMRSHDRRVAFGGTVCYCGDDYESLRRERVDLGLPECPRHSPESLGSVELYPEEHDE